jgi:peptide/nickel transport system substrate-binding protein
MTLNIKIKSWFILLILLLVLQSVTIVFATEIYEGKSISMHGEPGLSPGFDGYQHADTNSMQGGTLRLASLGTYDSMNPFIVKGRSAYGIRNYIFESLLSRNYSEPFSLYGLIAEKITYPEDRKWIEFHINKNARFSDGNKINPSDILFSFNQLREFGRPNHRNYYSRVKKVTITSDSSIKFLIKDDDDDRELILILGLMPILPEHIYGNGQFLEANLDVPIGSGPYTVHKIDQGKNITYIKDPNYWAQDLSINNGMNNFEKISIDYYLDDNSRFEAFKAGLFDLYQVWDPTRWNNLKSEKKVINGDINLLNISKKTPAGMLGLAMNTRKEKLSNINIRSALSSLFDFEWINKNLYHGLYNRTVGFYDNSYLSSVNTPVSPQEASLMGSSAVEMYNTNYVNFKLLKKKNMRDKLQDALKIFKSNGYILENSKLINAKTREPFIIEFLISDKRQEKYALNYKKNLEKIGIELIITMVDSTQYQKRKQNFDFDLIEHFWYASLSPGNEQYFYWGSKSADDIGSRNYAGIKDQNIDKMIDNLIASKKKEDFIAAAKSLDRLLISGHYIIPLFHWPHQWVATSNRVKQPAILSLDGYKINSWSINAE